MGRYPKVVFNYNNKVQLFKLFHSGLLHDDWMLKNITTCGGHIMSLELNSGKQMKE